ncbi:MAG: hypothetical protein Q3975_03845, partial [Oscillospiraceae bacterium]|nr:hypothetical protein [Oscillospiraceae bacterium]
RQNRGHQGRSKGNHMGLANPQLRVYALYNG